MESTSRTKHNSQDSVPLTLSPMASVTPLSHGPHTDMPLKNRAGPELQAIEGEAVA